MGSFSIWHWLIVLAVVLIVFGGSGKISTLMGDFAKGIKSFKKNLDDDESMEHPSSTPDGRISPPPANPANFSTEQRPTTSSGPNTH
ncbi:twin-arginine translocase TatA/TatE family subunit [Acetobacter sicerae]|uniref:Sec-independent protein translocase protein TatA n=1 Tax=Acetobacter sicerae TaxID=85325 RepID=A0ABS8VTG1_9PROT|nr:twin-arginine translocase TatA/TatE family subunit [Acetobacter sicerae]MCE0743456.1 twin-arginine translocase TatA/TatE family subunit [Acetobacter sicerae]NHN91728.1 twin-arginine translocase TatA/TatE family subunit [Acetobacter sicerae]